MTSCLSNLEVGQSVHNTPAVKLIGWEHEEKLLNIPLEHVGLS